MNYKKEFENLLDMVLTAPVSSGICCCGMAMDEPDYHTDHQAVDMWDNTIEGLIMKYNIVSIPIDETSKKFIEDILSNEK